MAFTWGLLLNNNNNNKKKFSVGICQDLVWSQNNDHEHSRNSLGSNSGPWICYANPLSPAHTQHLCYIQYWTPCRLYRKHQTAGPVRMISVGIYRERSPLPPSTEWGPAFSHLYMGGRTFWSFNIAWVGSSLGFPTLSGPWSSESAST